MPKPRKVIIYAGGEKGLEHIFDIAFYQYISEDQEEKELIDKIMDDHYTNILNDIKNNNPADEFFRIAEEPEEKVTEEKQEEMYRKFFNPFEF